METFTRKIRTGLSEIKYQLKLQVFEYVTIVILMFSQDLIKKKIFQITQNLFWIVETFCENMSNVLSV